MPPAKLQTPSPSRAKRQADHNSRDSGPACLEQLQTPGAPRAPRARVIHAGRLARMEHIHERLLGVRPDNIVKVTAESLAAELGRSVNTIYADFDAMRESFGAPIKYDPVRGTQYYHLPPGAPPYRFRPRVWLDTVDAVALMAGARRLFPFGPRMEAAIAKLLQLVDGAVTLDPATLETVCSTPDTAATEDDVHNFVFLFHAIVRRQAVTFTYLKTDPDAAPETRTVHPLHLVPLFDSCILVAHDPDPTCNDRRNLQLTRISELRLAGTTFLPPANFDLKTYLAGGTGPYLGEARYQIRVRFDPSYVGYVKKHRWHGSQELVLLPDGSAEATYRVAHTAIIEQHVLAAAGQAEVLDPPEVRARTRAAAQALLAKHRT